MKSKAVQLSEKLDTVVEDALDKMVANAKKKNLKMTPEEEKDLRAKFAKNMKEKGKPKKEGDHKENPDGPARGFQKKQDTEDDEEDDEDDDDDGDDDEAGKNKK